MNNPFEDMRDILSELKGTESFRAEVESIIKDLDPVQQDLDRLVEYAKQTRHTRTETLELLRVQEELDGCVWESRR